MLRGGPALATVFLCSVCLLAAPIQSRQKELCSLDRIKKVMSLNKALPTQMDVSLYTPSVKDYQQKCPSAAMSCFADELSVLCEEMKVSGLSCTQQRLILSLRKLAEKLNKSESRCRQCELHPEESPKVFLGVLLEVLQQINAENC
ncbi:interleukin 15, like [Gambusia affinis]|uniref:interleukin 15, like n=1 Tax=Gambusia affinis TaxID=33528 RepID=UPI001CDD171E|nr:interleukin 15, like [Gambusia affinis]